MRNIEPSGARLWESLMRMADIGATPAGGVNRLTLTAEDAAARALLLEWGKAVGCSVLRDRVGNLALLRPGTDATRKPVAIGSHLDTVPTGGKFDGAYGVLAGLEVLRTLHDAGVQTAAPIMLINWANEEGARFSPPMAASAVAMGFATEAALRATPDRFGGVAYGEALDAQRLAGDADPAVLRDLACYFEAHIEQGPELERLGVPLGIVTHAFASRYVTIEVTGADGHIGSPMAGRADALAGAAAMILAAERIGQASAGMVSVTRIAIAPDALGNIASTARLAANARHGETAGAEALLAALTAECETIATARGLRVAITRGWGYAATRFDPALMAMLERAATRRGIATHRMPCPIGHDAILVGQVLPAALLFIPCHGGLSHNEAESITPEWAEAGLRLLADAVLEAAG
jgi:beta-ureidopropionase / N-carbamoyl-L-amino-acid hydrolase